MKGAFRSSPDGLDAMIKLMQEKTHNRGIRSRETAERTQTASDASSSLWAQSQGLQAPGLLLSGEFRSHLTGDTRLGSHPAMSTRHRRQERGTGEGSGAQTQREELRESTPSMPHQAMLLSTQFTQEMGQAPTLVHSLGSQTARDARGRALGEEVIRPLPVLRRPPVRPPRGPSDLPRYASMSQDNMQMSQPSLSLRRNPRRTSVGDEAREPQRAGIGERGVLSTDQRSTGAIPSSRRGGLTGAERGMPPGPPQRR